MKSKKYLVLGLSVLLVSQTTSVSALEGTEMLDMSALTDISATEAIDSSSSSNGDMVVSDSDVRNGDYDVNGQLTVEGVLTVFGDLTVNGDLVIAKNAKLRVTGTLTVNGDLTNQGGSVYAKKRDVSGSTSGKARKLDSEVSQIDAILDASITGEEREALLQDILDSQKEVLPIIKEEFLENLVSKIQKEDAEAFVKLKESMLKAFKRKLITLGGMKDAMLTAFSKKLISMPTEKLEALGTKLDTLLAATKKKRFAFQLQQIKALVEEEIEARTTADELDSSITASGSTVAQ